MAGTSFSKPVFLPVFALAMVSSVGAQANGYNVLYSFCAQQNCADGTDPFASLVRDSAGNLYGTTNQGGAAFSGTVFVLAPDGTETVLHSFCSQQPYCSDGSLPVAGLIRDNAGNSYGTTAYGGPYMSGVAFKLAPDGTETVLHTFTGGSDGAYPWGTLIRDTAGNLYGTTTEGGGAPACAGYGGCGTVFKLAPDGTETLLHVFIDGVDGAHPDGGLIRGEGHFFYGTTSAGGSDNAGTVFKLSPDGTEKVIYSFKGFSDGASPEGALISDSAGNFYGTTVNGGGTGCGGNGCGTIFELAPDGSETVLYAFTGGNDGGAPYSKLNRDKSGNLYGTTFGGGASGYGTVFKLAPNGTETILHAFAGGTDGVSPGAGLIGDGKGNLVGTTEYGGGTGCMGSGCGTVFAVRK